MMRTYFTIFFGLFALTTAADQQQGGGCSLKSCKDTDGSRQICGSDGLTYPSRCHLGRAQCLDRNLTVVEKGPCRNQTSCVRMQGNFKPQCRPDGTFASAQCHPGAGYCWCVSSRGIPLPNSSVRWTSSKKPRCGQKRRRSSRSRSPAAKKTKRNCKQADRAIFNTNLMKRFHAEYVRQNRQALESDRAVLDWEFRRWDADQNSVLDKIESRDLRRVIKNGVKPKRCAKSFAKACDVNRDQLISIQEWAECLSKDGMDGGGVDSDNDEDEEDTEEEGGDLVYSRSPPHGVLAGGSRVTSGQNYEEDSTERRDEDATDCLSDRQTALSEQRADKLYVPECTPDGRYQKIQCYKSAGYCWCVNEDTGKNIPGTSVKNQTPKCDQIPSPSRPMKGCPDEKKVLFLKDLMEYLHQRMQKETNGTITGNGATWKASREEQVSTWSFVVFDKNKNKVLDRTEWKAFKDLMASVKNLKRCGKKLPRYCDINKDRQISMTEWIDCLNSQRHVAEHVATTVSPGLARTGTNPLAILFDD